MSMMSSRRIVDHRVESNILKSKGEHSVNSAILYAPHCPAASASSVPCQSSVSRLAVSHALRHCLLKLQA